MKVEIHSLIVKGLVPNNPCLPMLIYRGVPAHLLSSAERIKRHLSRNGWNGAWVSGIFPFHHYHARSHEVLVNLEGVVEVEFGGPGGLVTCFNRGDAVVLPAGTGHRRISNPASLTIVGAYPEGQEDWDLKRETTGDYEVAGREIVATPLPRMDPLFGTEGPLLEHWH